MSSPYIFQFLVSPALPVRTWGTVEVSAGGVMVCLLEYAGILLLACPGTGCPGVPFMFLILSGDHLSASGFLITDEALNTPTSVPMRCSGDRISNPSQIPSLHASSYLPGIDWVRGILKWTVSPNSATLATGCRPLIFCRDDCPSGRIRHRVMRHAACRTNQGNTLEPNLIFIATLLSKADLKVRSCPSISWIARSIVAFEFESPTADVSIEVP